MRLILSFVALWVALLPGAILVAQDETPSPRSPLVASRPLKGRYVIIHSYTEPLKEMTPQRRAELPANFHPRRVVKVEGFLDGTLKKEVRHWSDGEITECWVVRKMTLYDEPGIRCVLMLDPAAFTGEYGIPNRFPEFSWVSQEAMQADGKGAYKGRKAVHYKVGDEEAWIDPETRLPIAVRIRGTLQEYQFSGEPPPPLTLPPRFHAFLKELETLRNKPPGDV